MTSIRIASDRALLVEVEGTALDDATRMCDAIDRAAIDGVVELVPAACTVLVRFDPEVVEAPALAVALAAVEPSPASERDARSVVLPVRYDGDDLDAVANALGMSREAVVDRHASTTWTVAFMGFAPGFGYLAPEGPWPEMPRRATPRTRIPAGSVALAGTFSAVYPRASPGGWQLIGRTDATLWDLDRDPVSTLAPGVTVRFQPSTHIVAAPAPAARSAIAHGPIEVVRAGIQLLVQDEGRPGLAAMGVTASGVADRTAMHRANAAVGNAQEAAVLECLGDAALRAHAPLVAAVSGAEVDMSVHASDGQRRVRTDEPFPLDPGDELRLGTTTRGLRSVVAVRGGIAVPPVLGSRATDTLAGLGPEPLAVGDRVPVGDARTGRPVQPVPPSARELPAAGDVVTLDVVLGPRADWLTPSGMTTLLGQEWLVSARSDRVGIRLEGAEPLDRVDGELQSEGAVTGGLQVPPDGQPVLLLPDRPLTGGYPVVAAVVDGQLDVVGQLPPGTRVRLRVGEGARA